MHEVFYKITAFKQKHWFWNLQLQSIILTLLQLWEWKICHCKKYKEFISCFQDTHNEATVLLCWVSFGNTESVTAKYQIQVIDFLSVVGLKSAFQHASYKVFTALYLRVLVICYVLLHCWASVAQCSKEMWCLL